MAICNALANGITTSCGTNTGGIKKMWLADFDVVSYTQSGGEVSAVITNTPTRIANATASWSLTNTGGGWSLNILTLPGNYTQYLVGGVTQVRATYVDQFGTTFTITFPIIGSVYNAGPNTTSITPDWISFGYQPVVGPSSIPEINQSVWIGSLFYQFQFNRNTSSFEETIQTNIENGTTFFEQRIMLMLARRDKVKREAIVDLSDSQKRLACIILDNNGLYWVFGIQDGIVLQELAGGSGTAKTDANNYQLTFVGQESEQAYEISSTLVNSLIVNV